MEQMFPKVILFYFACFCDYCNEVPILGHPNVKVPFQAAARTKA
jgi:hypothetical protein